MVVAFPHANMRSLCELPPVISSMISLEFTDDPADFCEWVEDEGIGAAGASIVFLFLVGSTDSVRLLGVPNLARRSRTDPSETKVSFLADGLVAIAVVIDSVLEDSD
jgi:hypothetical protein